MYLPSPKHLQLLQDNFRLIESVPDPGNRKELEGAFSPADPQQFVPRPRFEYVLKVGFDL